MRRPVNIHRIRMARDLNRLSTTHKAPIWKRLSKEALKPSSARRTINVGDIARHTKSGDVVAFPGKVLGTGVIKHDITLFCFGITETAADKVSKSQGRTIPYDTLVSERPTGQEVVLLG